jgi:hypothetical protein
MSTVPTVALVVKPIATPDTRDEVARFLTGALEPADAEAGTGRTRPAARLASEIHGADVLAAELP